MVRGSLGEMRQRCLGRQTSGIKAVVSRYEDGRCTFGVQDCMSQSSWRRLGQRKEGPISTRNLEDWGGRIRNRTVAKREAHL